MKASEVEISKPDKVFYPDDQVTKGELSRTNAELGVCERPTRVSRVSEAGALLLPPAAWGHFLTKAPSLSH